MPPSKRWRGTRSEPIETTKGRYIMAQSRNSWGSNNPARRKGYRTLRYWADEHDGRGYMRHTMTIKGSKRDGDAKLAELRVKHGADAPMPTVGQAYELWYLPECQAKIDEYERRGKPGKNGETMKPSTMRIVKSAWTAHVSPRWGGVSVGDVRYSDVQEWLDGLTEQTARRGLTILKGTLRLCMLNEVIDRNVAAFSYRMPSKAARQDDGIYTLGQLSQIWRELYGTYAEAAFILAAFDGARSGEALAPFLSEVEEVEVEGYRMACVPFMRQVDENGRVSLEEDLKNVWSPRVSVVPPPFSDRILQIKAERESEGCVYLSDNGTGSPVSQCTARRAFYKALDRAGLQRRQMRSLRRSWRSWVSAYGISPEILEKMMGHVGDGTTGRHYLKMNKDILSREIHRAFKAMPVELEWTPFGINWDTE